MHVSQNELPLLFGDETAGLSGIDWEGMRVAILKAPAGSDFAPLLEGLPHDMCSSPHWGYIIEGRVKITYADQTKETLSAGDVYFIPPGHSPIVEEDLVGLEISPIAESDEVLAALERNAAAAEG